MKTKSELAQEIVGILIRLNTTQQRIDAKTLIITELDFDSLKMVEFIDTLKKNYGLDFLALENPLEKMRSAETIAGVLSGEASSTGL